MDCPAGLCLSRDLCDRLGRCQCPHASHSHQRLRGTGTGSTGKTSVSETASSGRPQQGQVPTDRQNSTGMTGGDGSRREGTRCETVNLRMGGAPWTS